MTLTAAILALTLSNPSACPAGLDAGRAPDGTGWHFTDAGKARVDAELTRLTREHAACTAERDFLHRVLNETPPKPPPVTETPSGYVVALAAGLAIGLTAGAYVTFRAMR